MRRASRFLLWLPMCGALLACSYGERRDDGYTYDPDPPSDEILRGTIDADASLDVEPGRGVGIFVEYETGGHWHIYTSCDTELMGTECYFDVVAGPIGSATVLGVSPENLETDDSISISNDQVRLLAYTDYDLDGLWIDTEPGAVLSLDVLLDGENGNEWIDWVGDDAVHRGAPSTPFELEPLTP